MVGNIKNEDFRQLIDGLPLFIVTFFPDGTLTYANVAISQSVGMTQDQLLGRNFLEFLSTDDRKAVQAGLAALTPTCPVETHEQHYPGADGNNIYHQWTNKAFFDADGKIIFIQAFGEDITERKQAELKLSQSEAALKSAQRITKVGSWVWSLPSNKTVWSDEMYRIFGVSNETMSDNLFEIWQKSIHPDDREMVEQANLAAIKQAYKTPVEYRIVCPDGTVRFLWAKADTSVHDEQGNPIEMSGVVQDITERKIYESELAESKLRWEFALEGAGDGVWDWNLQTGKAFFSRRYKEMLGYSDDEFGNVAEEWTKRVHPEDMPKVMAGVQAHIDGETSSAIIEHRLLCKDGSWKWVIGRGKVVSRDAEGKPVRIVGTNTDNTERKQYQVQLERIANYDALTGTPNRSLLADRMKQAIAQTKREQNMMGLCYLDLDGFKVINDTMGHAAGDDVLVEISKRIMGTIRGGDTVARLGGDEFVVLMLGLERGEECIATIQRLLDVISHPIAIKEKSVCVSASIGVSIYPLDDEDPDTLLRHADQAMYQAKQSGKNRFHIYDPELDQRARIQHSFLQDIRQALNKNQLVLYYQPKVEMKSKRLVGAEALIRWQHPERGLLPPVEFLRAIGNTDLDIAIGEWVVDTALAQIQKWRLAGLDIEVSVNISAFHLESRGFVEMLQQKVAQHDQIPAGKLQIEVLETAALDDVEKVSRIIESCKTFGVGFALDDFGTGYSSLTYLSKLPVDTLKIDQSFVRDMLEDKGDMAIVHGIIALARAFERQTVAEGIETEDHYQALLNMGCEIAQGYFIARPMPADELPKFYAKANKS